MSEGMITCNVAACTDVGVVRTNNEDNLILADLAAGQNLPLSCQVKTTVENNSLLMVVSDGMGGAEYGEHASELTVFAVKDALRRLPRSISAYDRIVAAVEEANKIVWDEGIANPHMKGMGATVTAALIDGDRVFIAEVGDSRAYLIRGNNIKQVTTDQSFVAMLIARGALKPEDAVQHPRKNVVLQSIGVQEAVQVAVSMFQLKRGDTLLLCSDGLSNLVHTGEMLYFAESQTPDEACRRLVDLAKQRGGPDNITVIIAKFDGDGLAVNTEQKGLTGMLQTLSIFNPEQEAEKSHKRTQLLGNSSIASRYYSGASAVEEPQTKMQIVTHLGNFPNSALLKQECHNLFEWLEHCEQVLHLKIEQIEQAAQWLENQGVYYVNVPDALETVKTGLENLERAKQAVRELFGVFGDNQS